MKRILIVEDDPALLEFEEGLLGREYQILKATTGEEALIKIRDERPDLVLLDVLLPNMSGVDVCQKVRQNPETRRIPIVMLTGQDKAESLTEGFEAGADMYINKPFSTKKLLAVVKAVLEKSVD
ncbi:MAG: response regulator [Acidobacteriota bacterium]